MTNPETTPVAANENAKPRQVELPEWIIYRGWPVHRDDVDVFIEYDCYFGQPQRAYPVGGDRDLPTDGAIMEFKNFQNELIYAALIPDELGYELDWEAGEASEPSWVMSWHSEWYSERRDAEVALRLGLDRASHVPNDQEGTWGIEGYGSAA